MGDSNQILSGLPKSFTREYLLGVIEETARQAAKETAKEIDEIHRREARRTDPGKSAQRMLSEYRRLKIAQKEDIQITEAEGLEMRWKYLKDLMGAPDRRIATEETAYMRERKLQYNHYKIQRIEAAIDMYRRECENSGNEEAMRRYRVVTMRYMEEIEKTVEEIAEKENVSVRSAYNDINTACKIIAVYLSAV